MIKVEEGADNNQKRYIINKELIAQQLPLQLLISFLLIFLINIKDMEVYFGEDGIVTVVTENGIVIPMEKEEYLEFINKQ